MSTAACLPFCLPSFMNNWKVSFLVIFENPSCLPSGHVGIKTVKMFNTQGQTSRYTFNGGGRGVQALRALATLAGDPSSVSSTHIRQLTTTCNFSSRRSNPLLTSMGHAHAHTRAHTHTHGHTCTSTLKHMFKITLYSIQHQHRRGVLVQCWREVSAFDWRVSPQCGSNGFWGFTCASANSRVTSWSVFAPQKQTESCFLNTTALEAVATFLFGLISS